MFSVLTEAHFIALYSHAESHPACCLHSGQVSDSVGEGRVRRSVTRRFHSDCSGIPSDCRP